MVPLDDVPAPVRRSLRTSVLEAMVWAVMFGFGETFFLADMVRRGAGPLTTAFVVALPACVGSLGSLLALYELRRTGRRRRLVVTGALVQAATLGVLAATARGSLATPGLLLAAACLYQVSAQASGTSWSSWFGDLVPTALRGRYFAGRNRGAHFVSFASMLGAGFVLQHFEPSPTLAAELPSGAGFQLIYAVAAGARLVSAGLMLRCHEPRFLGVESFRRVRHYLAATRRGARAWRLVLAGGLFNFGVYVAAPFFGPFMLEDLAFSYVEYTAATVLVVATKVGALPFWGRRIDRFGTAKVLFVAIALIALVPLPFAVTEGAVLVFCAQAVSGVGWGAYEVGHFSALLEATYKRSRPALFASLSVVNGTAQLVGVAVAAPLLAWLGDVRALFVASAVLRGGSGIALALLLRGHGRSEGALPEPGRAPHPVFRVLGFRPGGGVAVRPVLGSPAGAESAESVEAEEQNSPVEEPVGRATVDG